LWSGKRRLPPAEQAGYGSSFRRSSIPFVPHAHLRTFDTPNSWGRDCFPRLRGGGLAGLLAMTCGGGGIGNLGILRGERGNCAEQSQFAAGGFGCKVSCEKELGEKDAILPR
jgi:hypothetical protein